MEEESPRQNMLDAARERCLNQTETTNVVKSCELIFDGLMCWPRTMAGALASQPCRTDYMQSTKAGLATKKCDYDGNWFIPTNSNTSWTNYTACGKFFVEITPATHDEVYQKWVPIIKNITQCGYIISICTLLIALLILIKIRKLHCARNKLHIHLFVSFIIRALMSLLKDGLFVKGTALAYDTIYIEGEATFTKDNNSWVCKVIISLRFYFIVSNYMFLLMEAVYLHNLMFLNLLVDSGTAIYYCLGWSLPLFFIIPWIILKIKLEDTYCWTQKASTHIALLIDLPIGLIVIINFLLFIVIVRVLFIKLGSMYVQQSRIKYKKLIRSTLILLPLFGIPYIISFVLSFYVLDNKTLEIVWLFFDQSFSAFQGLFASLVYCLLNSEVQMELKRKYNSFKDRNNKEFRRSRTISHTQQLNDELQEFPKDWMVVKKDTVYF